MIWLLLLVLVGGFAALGYSTGAVRATVSLIGIFIAVAVAGLVGGLIAPILPKAGVSDLLWQAALPGVIGFLVVWLVFFGAGFAAHKPVELHFKYREDDTTRQQFEKMNHALGLFVGLLGGVVVFFAAGKPLYSLGYLTTQTANESGEPKPVTYLNQARNGMNGSGWDRVFAALDKTPARQYESADVLGLIHENPATLVRLKTYPPFLALAETAEFADVLADAEYLQMLENKAGFSAFYNHAKTQTILASTGAREALAKINLADLKTYLETGKSPLYEGEQILGRWRADVTPTIIDARRRRTDLQPAQLRNLRMVLNAFLKPATVTAYPDGRFVLTIPTPSAPEPQPQPDPNDPNAAAAAVPGGMDPALAARYGLGRGAPPAAPAAPTAALTAPTDPVTIARQIFASLPQGLSSLSTDGQWTKTAGRYVLTFKQGGKDEIREARISELGRLEIPLPELKMTLFFVPTI